MSQLIKIGALFIMMLVLGIVGCGDPNSQVSFDPDTGQHIAGWYPMGHKNAASTSTTPCTECHASDFSGGISGVSCASCHLTAGNFSCSQCHNYPPNQGAHPKHNLAGVSCLACHSDTIGTSRHTDATDYINISAEYYSKNAAASFSSGLCSNVRCHGGPKTQSAAQADLNPPGYTNTQTPAWTSGTAVTACTACHVLGTADYNSYYSGEHKKHVYGEGVACTSCHDTTLLATNHFRFLSTVAMEGPASATLLSSLNYNGSSCDPACHGPKDWR